MASRLNPQKLRAHRHPKRRNRFRPILELLEDRTAMSVVPAQADHFYSFDDSLDDQNGGPALISDGGTLDAGRYTFSANQGLRLQDGLDDPNDFSIVMNVQFDGDGNDYQKLIDFANRSSDDGFYIANSTLQLYPGDPGRNEVRFGSDFQIALTRDGDTGVTSVYINGVLERQYVASASDAAVAAGNLLVFFEDDLTTAGAESASGSIDYLAIYHRALTADEINGISNEDLPPVIVSGVSSVSGYEGQTLQVTGTWSHPQGVETSLSASIGTVSQNIDGSWIWTYTPADGPVDPETVIITAVDANNAEATTSFTLSVFNAAPHVSVGTSVSAATPSHFYDLTTGLNDTMGGPSLQANGGTFGADGFTFTNGEGLRLEGALADPANYTIVVNARLEPAARFFQKLIDFQNGAADQGFYLAGGQLQLFPANATGPVLVAGQHSQIVLTRDGLTGEARIYLNGRLLQTSTGEPANFAIPGDNILAFFQDDFVTNGTEYATGSVSSIATYDSPLSLEQVAALYHSTGDGGADRVTVSEGETAFNFGIWSDPGNDEVALTASIGDIVKNDNGSWSWSFSTTSGPQQSQTVIVTATDSDGASSQTSFELIVNNVPPTLTADEMSINVDEGQTAEVHGTFFDVGNDSVVLTASVGAIRQQADGTWSWVYKTVDGPDETQMVTVTATDSDGGVSQVTFELVVNNLPPNLAVNASTVDVEEGQTATVAGTWGDAGNDQVILAASVGAMVKNANGTWSWVYQTKNGPSESQTITITATDDDGDVTSATFALTVHNVAPTISLLTNDHASLDDPASDGQVSLTGTFTDPGLGDLHTVTVDWGDGSKQTFATVDQVKDAFKAGHRYQQGGIFTITVSARDQDGGESTATSQAVVTGIGLVDGVLYVIGTAGNDRIEIDKTERTVTQGKKKVKEDVLTVEAQFNQSNRCNTPTTVATFDPSTVQRIVVIAGAGNDDVTIEADVTKDAFLLGGSGNDRIQGGGGNNVIVGGNGNDQLIGRKRDDIIIGGQGKDKLNGKRGDDLLIGDAMSNQNSLQELDAALNAWLHDDLPATMNALGVLLNDGVRDRYVDAGKKNGRC